MTRTFEEVSSFSAISILLMNSSYNPIPKIRKTVPIR